MIGYNYRMTDIQAAVGREQLKRMPEIIATRRALADRYRELLKDDNVGRAADRTALCANNWQSFVVRLPESCDQRAVMQAMLDDGSPRGAASCARIARRDTPR